MERSRNIRWLTMNIKPNHPCNNVTIDDSKKEKSNEPESEKNIYERPSIRL